MPKLAIITSGGEERPLLRAPENSPFTTQRIEMRVPGFARNPYDRFIVALAHIDAAERAVAEGCDAIFLDTFADYGLAEMRCAVPIPVIGAGEAGIITASANGTRDFAIVTVWPQSMNYLYKERLDTVLGFAVPTVEVERSLRTLGFEVSSGVGEDAESEAFTVVPPWWRTDVSIPDDIAEEVLRTAGYDRLPATSPRGAVPAHEVQPIVELRDWLRDALAAAGLREVITYSLTTEESQARVIPAELLAERPSLALQNTLSSEHAVLRQSLRHSILETVARNIRAGATRIAIFEAGRAYIPRSLDAGGPLPDGRTARLLADKAPVGWLAEVHPRTLEAFEIDRPVILFELDLAALLPHVPARYLATAPSRFPAVEQDIALVVDDSVAAGALQAAIESSRLVASARVFDVYRSEQLGAGKKSVALSVRYQAPDRTLTTEDANKEQARLLARLAREFGAALRG